MSLAKELFEFGTSAGMEAFTGFITALWGIGEAIRTSSIPPAVAALIGFGMMVHSVSRNARGPNIGG